MSLNNMTHEELQKLIAEAVRQTLVQMGADPSNPIEMQRDFQHLRQWRKAGEDLRSEGMLTLLSIFVTGSVALFLVGLRDYFGK